MGMSAVCDEAGRIGEGGREISLKESIKGED